MEALYSSETSVLTGATQRNIPEDGILQCYEQVLCEFIWFLYLENIVRARYVEFMYGSNEESQITDRRWSSRLDVWRITYSM
jgi:hypothetical protein